MAASTMDMTVIQLFGRSSTDFNHFDIKVKVLTRQRVVAIDSDVAAIYGGNSDDLHAMIGLGMELHADFNGVYTLEHFLGHNLHQAFVFFAVAICRGNADLEAVTNLLAFEGIFKAGNDVASAVKVGQRLTANRTVDHCARVIGQCVFDTGHEIFCDLHVKCPWGV